MKYRYINSHCTPHCRLQPCGHYATELCVFRTALTPFSVNHIKAKGNGNCGDQDENTPTKAGSPTASDSLLRATMMFPLFSKQNRNVGTEVKDNG
jgi:hypothetical protein